MIINPKKLIIITIVTPTMLRNISKFARYYSSTIKIPCTTSDLSNMIGYINTFDKPTMTFPEKVAYFYPSHLYNSLDVYYRQLIFTIAHDYHLGLPAGVLITTLSIRVIFAQLVQLYSYLTIKGQIVALKMKQLTPLTQRYQQKMKIAQMTGNRALMTQARTQLTQMRKNKGIDNFYSLMNLIQIPFQITYFFSLRYIAALPQIFPSINQPLLWIQNFSIYDPYFILPISSAIFSSFAIMITPGLNKGKQSTFLQPFIKYLKYLPFLSLPFTGFFPAVLTLYWCFLSLSQVALMAIMNTRFIQQHYAVSIQESKSQIKRVVFIEEKPKIPTPLADTTIKTRIATTATATGGKIKQKQSQKQKESNIPLHLESLEILKKKPKKGKKINEKK